MCFLARVATSGESLRGEVLVQLIGAVVCLLAAYRGSDCTLTRAMNGRNLRCSTIVSCHFLRLYSAAGRGIAAVSSAIEESDLYLFSFFTSVNVVVVEVRRACSNEGGLSRMKVGTMRSCLHGSMLYLLSAVRSILSSQVTNPATMMSSLPARLLC